MNFDACERLADAVLFEGYVLYPYRRSAAKNHCRWQFGVIAPRSPHEDGEPWFAQTECLATGAARLTIRVRCLRPRRQSADWLDGVPSSIDIGPVSLEPAELRTFALDLDIAASATIRAERCDPFVKVQVRLENREPWRQAFSTDRDVMLERSLTAAHVLLGLDGGAFVSLLEPPPEAAALVGACANRHTWPVLVGDRSRRDAMLSSPIVLYDYPAVAPESQGDLCDAAEIDEILSLRILTLTAAEKAEARATDPRARAILDRVEAMTADDLNALHGALRTADFFNPPGDVPWVVVGNRRVGRGSRVRLRPNRRADAMDIFLKDQDATVAGVYRDVDERVYVAVTVDADPGASLHESFGRFFYFDPSEIETLDREQEPL